MTKKEIKDQVIRNVKDGYPITTLGVAFVKTVTKG